MFTARQLLLQETDVIRLSFITSAVYAFACALTGVMWREWVVTGGGNANFVFGVRFVFISFSHARASSRSLPAVPCLWLIRKRPFLSAVQCSASRLSQAHAAADAVGPSQVATKQQIQGSRQQGARRLNQVEEEWSGWNEQHLTRTHYLGVVKHRRLQRPTSSIKSQTSG
jgi:hypothetical protein